MLLSYLLIHTQRSSFPGRLILLPVVIAAPWYTQGPLIESDFRMPILLPVLKRK